VGALKQASMVVAIRDVPNDDNVVRLSMCIVLGQVEVPLLEQQELDSEGRGSAERER